ncbi:MAG: hypothetical protein AABY22_04945 [Nanoarchaeota archaeon]
MRFEINQTEKTITLLDEINFEELMELQKFMGDGWKEWKHEKGKFTHSERNITKFYCISEMKYHSSWDWLKPVIDKIFQYALAYPDQIAPIRKTSVVVEIKSAHEIVFQFIQWYNKQNK